MKGIKFFHEFSLQQEKNKKKYGKEDNKQISAGSKKNFNLLIL